jgi:hypothetical protein
VIWRRGDAVNVQEKGIRDELFQGEGLNISTYNGNDRVIYMFSTWARLKGYSPLRFNNVCP